MRVYFEELPRHKRAGGIETACSELVEQMRRLDVSIIRSAETAWNFKDSLPDCVHIQGLWSPALAKRFLQWKLLNVPCVVSPHGMLETWALAHKFLRKKIAWWLYQKPILNRSAALHATSETEARQFQRLGLKAKVFTIPWGVTTTASNSLQGNLSQVARTAIFAGRLCPVKGLPMLFEAWKNVRPHGWNLKIIGPDEGGYRATLESMVRDAGIEKSVSFLGEFTKAELQTACLQADLFVLPSHSENFGMVVGEALALGLPVLTTRATPWKRIADTKCGWWVPPTVEELTSALREATSTSSGDLRAMGVTGAELVRREYSWEAAVQKFHDLYKSLSVTSPRRS